MKPFYIRKSAIRALERATDAESWEMLGALGVAAEPYPHQIANVRHILMAPEIRHLIADEVGLGKTVQAFMILNVLRRRDPSLRVAIVAPERICYQWQSELSARAHIRAELWNGEVQTDRPDGEGCVHVIRAEIIRAEPALPSPQEYDMLIVDEPHILSLRQMSFLATWCRAGLEGSRFRHVLLLTATPRLGNSEWTKSLFNILEPDRSDAATILGRDPLEHISAATTESNFQDHSGDGRSPYRRILRQTRKRWPAIAPHRRIETCVAQPSETELARIALASAALAGQEAISQLRLDAAPWQPTRQLFWSRDTVLESLRHKTFAEFAGQVDHCRTVLGRSPGDSLFEQLCDVLLQIWEQQPDRRVIIVAGDTAAVDMIEQRLSRLFPTLAENELIATMRGRQNTDLVDVVNAVHGGARVLIMEEWVEAGLNLHHFADDIVFYGLPWSVGRIDQLIGRLDRLRPGGLRKAIKGHSVAEITIWRLVLRDSPDERVLKALDRMRLFELPLPFLGDEIAGRMDRVIANAAAGARGFLEMADLLAKEIHSGEEELSALAERHAGAEPTTKTPLSSLIRTAEKRSQDILRTFDVSGAFRVGWPKTVSGERVAMLSLPKVIGNCPFAIGGMTTRESEALRVARHRFGTSPDKDVLLPGDGLGRRARFFSTGDDLHDELVRQALALGLKQDKMPGPRPVAISFPSDHEANALIGTTIAITAFAVRPTIKIPSIKSLMSQYGDWKYERKQGFRLLHEGLVVGIDADQRWVSIQFPSVFRLVGTQIGDSGEGKKISQDICQSILSVDGKLRDNSMGIPSCLGAAEVFHDHIMMARPELAKNIADMDCAAKVGLENRITELMQDAADYIRARNLNIERLESRNITDVRQRQMQDGQIATERRRIEARQQSAMIRARLLSETIDGLARGSEITALRLLVRVIPPIGASL